jgi:N-acetylglutamate synthase-like GNAT family acetyltransferase
MAVWRRLDNFEEHDQLLLKFDAGTDITCVTVVDEDETVLARASYSEDYYENTIALNHLEVEGAHQNKGIGSKLLRCLFHSKWQGHFVRIWNPAPRAEKFYRRLGFLKRTSEVEKGEMWFRMAAQAAGEWPTVEAKDLGDGPRSHLARVEEQAEQAKARVAAAERAQQAALAKTSILCGLEGCKAPALAGCVEMEQFPDGSARVAVVDGPWAGETYAGGWDVPAGTPHGAGKLTLASGKTYAGDFHHGVSRKSPRSAHPSSSFRPVSSCY